MALTGHTQVCAENRGGVRRVAITERANVTSWTVDVNGQVTAITMASGTTFEIFENESETVEFTENGTFVNKSTVYEQLLDASWMGWNNDSRKSLLSLYANSPCGLVVIHLEESGGTYIWGILPTDTAEDVKFVARMEKSTRKTGKKLDDPSMTEYQLKARNIAPAAVFTPGWAGVPL